MYSKNDKMKRLLFGFVFSLISLNVVAMDEFAKEVLCKEKETVIVIGSVVVTAASALMKQAFDHWRKISTGDKNVSYRPSKNVTVRPGRYSLMNECYEGAEASDDDLGVKPDALATLTPSMEDARKERNQKAADTPASLRKYHTKNSGVTVRPGKRLKFFDR